MQLDSTRGGTQSESQSVRPRDASTPTSFPKYKSQLDEALKSLKDKEWEKSKKQTEAFLKETEAFLRSEHSPLEVSQIRALRAQAYEILGRFEIIFSPASALAESTEGEKKQALKLILEQTEKKADLWFKKAEDELRSAIQQEDNRDRKAKLAQGIAGVRQSRNSILYSLYSYIADKQGEQEGRVQHTAKSFDQAIAAEQRHKEMLEKQLASGGRITNLLKDWSGERRQLEFELEESKAKREYYEKRKGDYAKQAATVDFRALKSHKKVEDLKGATLGKELDELRGAINSALSVDLRFMAGSQVAKWKTANDVIERQSAEVVEWYKGTRDAVRNVAIGFAATAATGGIGGLVIAAGLGTSATIIGLAGAAVVGTVAGTATGATMKVVEIESSVAQGIYKDHTNLYSQFGETLSGDAKTAGIASVATATGLGVARNAGIALGARAETALGEHIIGTASAGSGSIVSTTFQVGSQLYSATQEFLATPGLDFSKTGELLGKYNQFLEQRRLTISDVAKQYVVNFAVASVGGYGGAKADQIRKGTSSLGIQIASSIGEQVLNSATGLAGAAILADGSPQAADVVSEIGNAVFAGIQARSAINAVRKMREHAHMAGLPDSHPPAGNSPVLPIAVTAALPHTLPHTELKGANTVHTPGEQESSTPQQGQQYNNSQQPQPANPPATEQSGQLSNNPTAPAGNGEGQAAAPTNSSQEAAAPPENQSGSNPLSITVLEEGTYPESVRRELAKVGGVPLDKQGAQRAAAIAQVMESVPVSSHLAITAMGFSPEDRVSRDGYHHQAQILSTVGEVPPSSPVVQYQRGVYEKVAKAAGLDLYGEKAPSTHLAYVEEPAFALGNGSVMINPVVYKICRTEDELAALMVHELLHGRELHLKQLAVAEADVSLGRFQKGNLLTGISRKAEYEADLLGPEILSKAGYNPLAMESLLGRLREFEEMRKSWDIAHGALLDRRINVLRLAKLLDLKGSEAVQKPIPQQVKEDALALPKKESAQPKHRQDLLTGKTSAIEEQAARVRATGSSADILLGLQALGNQYNELVEVARNDLHLAAQAEANAKRRGERVQPDSKQKSPDGSIQLGPMSKSRSSHATGLANRVATLSNAIGDALLARGVSHEDLPSVMLVLLASNSEVDIFRKRTVAGRLRETAAIADIPLPENRWLGTTLLGDLAERGPDVLHGCLRSPIWNTALASLATPEAMDSHVASIGKYLHQDLERYITEEGKLKAKSLAVEFNKMGADVAEWHRRYSGGTEEPAALTYNFLQKALPVKDIERVQKAAKNEAAPWSAAHEKFKEASKEPEKGTLAWALKDPALGSGPTIEQSAKIIASEYERKGNRLWDEIFSQRPQEASRYLNLLGNIRNSPEGKVVMNLGILEYLSTRPDIIANCRLEAAGIFWQELNSVELPIEQRIALFQRLSKQVDSEDYRMHYEVLPDRTEYTQAVIAHLKKVSESDPAAAIELSRRLNQDSELALLAACFGPQDELPTARLHQEAVERMWKAQKGPEDMLAIAGLFIDPEQAEKVKRYAFERLYGDAPFETLRDVLLTSNEFAKPQAGPIVDRLANKLASTRSQLDEVEQGVSSLLRRSADSLGSNIALLDAAVHHQNVDFPEVLRAGVESRHDNTRLLDLLLSEWWMRSDSLGIANKNFNATTADYIGWDVWSKETLLGETIRAADDSLFDHGSAAKAEMPVSVDEMAGRLYRMTSLQRGAFLQKVLATEEKGAIFHPAKLAETVLGFIGNHVDGAAVSPLLKEIVSATIDVATPEERALIAGGLLSPIVFLPPAHEAERSKVVRENETVRAYWEDAGDSHHIDNFYAKVQAWTFPPNPYAVARAEENIVHSLPAEYWQRETPKKHSPIEAIIVAAQQYEGPGKRATQIAPQYLSNLTPEQRKAFGKSYYKEEGQSKLAAFRTIKREAEQLMPKGSTAELGDALGGGSQQTVFDYVGPDGKPGVVKVLNPNAERLINDRLSLAERATGRLIQAHPESKWFRIVGEQLIPDLRKWMIDEINDTRFFKLDPGFKKKWDGFKHDKRSKFSIYVPGAYDLKTKYVKHEEKVLNAKTLAELTIGDKTDVSAGTITKADWDDLTKLVKAHYEAQVADGVVHSNPTPGNYMLTPDNKLAVIDRSYYLEFSKTDRTILLGLRSDIGWARDLAIGKFVDQMVEENKASAHIDPRTKEEAVKAVQAIYKNGKEGNRPMSEVVTDALTELREKGIKIPLRYTILGMNFGAIEFIGDLIHESAP